MPELWHVYQEKWGIGKPFMLLLDLNKSRPKQCNRKTMADTSFFITQMFPFHLGIGREMITLEIFSHSLIYVLRDHIQEKYSIFNIIKAPTCYYILQEKKKIQVTGDLKITFWAYLTNTADIFESLMFIHHDFYNTLTLCVKYINFLFMNLWLDFWSEYKLKQH